MTGNQKSSDFDEIILSEVKPEVREMTQVTDKVLSREKLTEAIRSLLKKYRADSAILFGSYARLEADAISDVDVVIYGGPEFDPTDVFSLAEDLHRLTRKAVDVYEIREIDQQSDFYQTILREGVRIAA